MLDLGNIQRQIYLPEIYDEHVVWITDVRGTKSTMKLVVKLV